MTDYMDREHRRLQEQVDAGELLSDTENRVLCDYRQGRPLFQKFPKIPRFSRDIVITEKIDGTNAQVFISEGGDIMWVGSRNRWLTDTEDNYSFRAWAREHADELRQLGPGRHCGEWWGQGIQRNYGLTERRFSLFNVSRWTDLIHEKPGPLCEGFYLDNLEEPIVRQPAPICCHVVPILYVGPWRLDNIQQWGEEMDALSDTMFALGDGGSRAAPGFRDPEGVVVFHGQSGRLFKKTFKGDEYQVQKKGSKHGS